MTRRVLCVMGSGETSPTMAKVHRELVDPAGTAVVLDTPFGFQANADELTRRAIAYFEESVGCDLGVASLRDAAAASPLDIERMLARLREATYVFAGPGSPTYALRHWKATPVPDVLAGKLRDGGVVTFASAAALTVGRCTIPVYEIYKVGAPVEWAAGLDLLSPHGLDVAVVPHWNNAEGGTHDTRYCYMGEGRLRVLEEQLPDGTFVLGVDEHTGCILDLDERVATVVGLGAVHVRRDGGMRSFPTGTAVPFDDLVRPSSGPVTLSGAETAPGQVTEPSGNSPLLDEVAGIEAAFDTALAGADGPGAAGALLDLDALLERWGNETFSGDEMDRARRSLRAMVARLGETATVGLRSRREVVGPFVETALAARARLRAAGEYGAADGVRDSLTALGVDVRDTLDGTTWDVPG